MCWGEAIGRHLNSGITTGIALRGRSRPKGVATHNATKAPAQNGLAKTHSLSASRNDTARGLRKPSRKQFPATTARPPSPPRVRFASRPTAPRFAGVTSRSARAAAPRPISSSPRRLPKASSRSSTARTSLAGPDRSTTTKPSTAPSSARRARAVTRITATSSATSRSAPNSSSLPQATMVSRSAIPARATPPMKRCANCRSSPRTTKR